MPNGNYSVISIPQQAENECPFDLSKWTMRSHVFGNRARVRTDDGRLPGVSAVGDQPIDGTDSLSLDPSQKSCQT